MRASARSREAAESDVDDAGLVRACLEGREEAWEALVRRYRRLIYSIAVSFRFDADNADEVFQRTALKLIENLARLRSIGALSGWIATVARHECEALWHHRRRSSPDGLDDVPEGSEPPVDVPEALAAVEREHAVTLAMERIGEPCRGLLHALYIEDPTPSYNEISTRLGRPVGALGPTRARCLKKLKSIYLEMGGPDL